MRGVPLAGEALGFGELGRYSEAATVQHDLIAAAQQAGSRDLIDALARNLALYDRGAPCRTPWTPDELP